MVLTLLSPAVLLLPLRSCLAADRGARSAFERTGQSTSPFRHLILVASTVVNSALTLLTDLVPDLRLGSWVCCLAVSLGCSWATHPCSPTREPLTEVGQRHQFRNLWVRGCGG
ncbi:hypothetical protein AUEXF2481DRAFT_422124 [Aureobasidium subglaciale EXF-2481]|uniref:Secreted protein n=1 Tax=Aureobasidium subglaciale (strain EXF-2481) TaxID=1043005 RepID=A0A074Y406_AURSE|nr:uncharacterized protein AUEXF2481DRAFT_422124 [Aureobasidium subglaciale EXF-2481]KEQ92528.1 hypothetical protein AUEXF2481DRAFT_422124 [Aureobasidium subglaciale EXF-2481]